MRFGNEEKAIKIGKKNFYSRRGHRPNETTLARNKSVARQRSKDVEPKVKGHAA